MNSNPTYRNLNYWKNPDFLALLYFPYTIDMYYMDWGKFLIFWGGRPSKGSTDMTSD